MSRKGSLLIAVSLAFGASGCGPSKVEQCNAFIDVANVSQNAFVALEAAALNPDSLKTRVDKIDASVGDLKKVELKDEKLVGFRNRYADGLAAYAKGLGGLVELGKGGDPEKANPIIDTLNAESEKMDKLIDEVNTYCSGSE